MLAVTGPLRGSARHVDERLEAERAELDALKEAKYRDIRACYAELDSSARASSANTDWKSLERSRVGAQCLGRSSAKRLDVADCAGRSRRDFEAT